MRALQRRRYRTLVELCGVAEITLRVTGGQPPLVTLWEGPGHAYTVRDDLRRVYLVDRLGLPQGRAAQAFRILEIVAFGFNDYFARETLCGRGYFVADVTPEHGRAWLSEIGRTGGHARSIRKAASSRRNGHAFAHRINDPAEISA